MQWTFRILAALNLVLLAVTFFHRAPGEDPAGRAMREGFTVIHASALIIVVLLYTMVRAPWVRMPLLVLLALPFVLQIAFML